MTRPNLATSSYRALTADQGVGVATSVGKPRGWQGNRAAGIPSRPALNPAAPYGVFNVKPPLPEPEFRARYVARLDAKAADIDAGLDRLAAAHPGQRLVLLCWCTIGEPDGFCHRRMLARWLEARYLIEVPELTLAPAR